MYDINNIKTKEDLDKFKEYIKSIDKDNIEDVNNLKDIIRPIICKILNKEHLGFKEVTNKNVFLLDKILDDILSNPDMASEKRSDNNETYIFYLGMILEN